LGLPNTIAFTRYRRVGAFILSAIQVAITDFLCEGFSL
jgi:hypothetical protein